MMRKIVGLALLIVLAAISSAYRPINRCAARAFQSLPISSIWMGPPKGSIKPEVAAAIASLKLDFRIIHPPLLQHYNPILPLMKEVATVPYSFVMSMAHGRIYSEKAWSFCLK